MRIELKANVTNAYGRFSPGEVVDWPAHDAVPLLRSGAAVEPSAAFASPVAAQLAGDVELEPGGGTGRSGSYTADDIRDLTGWEDEDDGG